MRISTNRYEVYGDLQLHVKQTVYHEQKLYKLHVSYKLSNSHKHHAGVKYS